MLLVLSGPFVPIFSLDAFTEGRPIVYEKLRLLYAYLHLVVSDTELSISLSVKQVSPSIYHFLSLSRPFAAKIKIQKAS